MDAIWDPLRSSIRKKCLEKETEETRSHLRDWKEIQSIGKILACDPSPESICYWMLYSTPGKNMILIKNVPRSYNWLVIICHEADHMIGKWQPKRILCCLEKSMRSHTRPKCTAIFECITLSYKVKNYSHKLHLLSLTFSKIIRKVNISLLLFQNWYSSIWKYITWFTNLWE